MFIVSLLIEEFERADTAAALVQMTSMDLAQGIILSAKMNNCKHVFLGGSFPTNQYIRTIITEEFTRRNVIRDVIKGNVSIQLQGT